MSVFGISIIEILDLGYCKFDLIPPVTVMFLNQKLKELKLYSKRWMLPS